MIFKESPLKFEPSICRPKVGELVPIPTVPVSALITKAGVLKVLFPTPVEGVISNPLSTLS